MVHTFAYLPSEVSVVESEKGPACVKIIKDSPFSSKPNDGMTVVHLDWTTACQVAEAVVDRLEEAEHEGQCGLMKLVR
jgi:Trk-type K+ transport system membrane component